MKEEMNYSKAPSGYLMCMNQECAEANNCLRQLVAQSVTPEEKTWHIVSPMYLETLTGSCPYYKSTDKVRYAKGFIKMLGELPHKQVRMVTVNLMRFFGERKYYRVRKGERLLSPSEQEDVLLILRKCGVSPLNVFDSFVENNNW